MGLFVVSILFVCVLGLVFAGSSYGVIRAYWQRAPLWLLILLAILLGLLLLPTSLRNEPLQEFFFRNAHSAH